MSSHLVFRDSTLSRRRFVSSLAVAAAASSTVVLAATAARAATPEWQEYRDEGIGFRFELPGKFKFNLYAPANDKVVRGANVEAEFDGMTVLFNAVELRDPETFPADYYYELARAGAPMTGNLPTREEERTVSGVPATDFIREADKVNYINRLVTVDNRIIFLSVLGLYHDQADGHLIPGDHSIHGNPTVLRILDSLALLRGGR